MHLYLLRHGIAVEPDDWRGDEFSRPLTPEGFEKTEAVLRVLHEKHGLAVDAIWSSPLLRAKQTADIAARILGLPVTLCDALACGATLSGIAREFKQHTPPARLLLTGHEPDCGEILGDLTDAKKALPFKKAGSAHARGEFTPGGMKLEWQLAPKDVL